MIKDSHRPYLDKTIKKLDSSFFFYDLDALKDHLEHMDSFADEELKLWYACKANPLSSILKIFRNLNFGIDVASQGELEQVLRAGIKPKDILSTGPSKSRKYMRSLLDNDVNIVVLESLSQAYWLQEVAQEMGKNPDVILRVQLEWKEGTSVLGGNEITPFGITPTEWLKLDQNKLTNLNIKGFHLFQWGNILDLNELEKIWDLTCKQLTDLATEMKITPEIIDLGGGLGIPYTSEEVAINFADIKAILNKLKGKYSLQKIWMELGRYAVGPFGHYFSQVIDRKTVRGKELLVLDGGINHIARPALTDQAFPCQVYRESDAQLKEFQVHGPLCTALDKLGTFQLPADVDYGDWLVFSAAGAYGFTEAMPFFLCHNLPAEVVLYQGDLMTPRPIKTSNDWLH